MADTLEATPQELVPTTQVITYQSTEPVPTTPESDTPPSVGDETSETTPSPDGDTTVDPITGDEGTDKATVDADADESGELDEAVLKELAAAYKEEILKTEPIQEQIQAQVREEVRRQALQAERERSQSTVSQAAIEKGKQAVLGLTKQAAAATEELRKAAEGEEFNPKAFDPTSFAQNLREFSSAIVEDFTTRYDTSIEEGFQDVFESYLPELTENQASELAELVGEAQRLEQDPSKTGEARGVFIRNLFRFVAQRAHEHGIYQAVEQIKNKKDVKDRLADSNAIRAAKAKLEANKVPPSTEQTTPESVSGNPYDLYDQLVKDGKIDEAQRIVDRLAVGSNSLSR